MRKLLHFVCSLLGGHVWYNYQVIPKPEYKSQYIAKKCLVCDVRMTFWDKI